MKKKHQMSMDIIERNLDEFMYEFNKQMIISKVDLSKSQAKLLYLVGDDK